MTNSATITREIETKLANYAAQESGLNDAIAAADQRAIYLTAEIAKLEPAVSNGFVTRKYVEDRRVELNAARLRMVDAQNVYPQAEDAAARSAKPARPRPHAVAVSGQ